VVAGGLAMLRAMRAAHWFIAVSLLTALVPHLVGLALVTRYAPSAPLYLTGFVIAVGLAAVLVAVLVRPTFDRRHRAAVVQAFKLGLPVVPHSLALMVLTQGAVSALFLISGARLAGEFYIIQVLATGSIQVVSALNNVWVTDIMDFADRSLQDAFTKTASKALLLGSALTLAASGMAPFVLWVLAPDSPGLSLPGALLPAIAVAYVVYLQCNTLMFVQARTASLALVTPVVAVVSLAMVSAAALTSDLRWVAAEYTASFVLLGVTYFALLHSWHTVTWPRRELVIASASIVVAVASVGLTDRFGHAALRAVALGLAAVGLLLVAVVSAPRPEDRSTRTSTATR
jgi:O-antigen/teichoic acid export membrane protein